MGSGPASSAVIDIRHRCLRLSSDEQPLSPSSCTACQPIDHLAEDEFTGKFGESRFTSQALKSDEVLLSCMTFVDLNPVRAGMADTPEASSYTNLRERLQTEFDVPQAIDDQTACSDLLDFRTTLKPLLLFENSLPNEPQIGVQFNVEQYLTLVDWTGRTIRGEKRGHIDSALPPILSRL